MATKKKTTKKKIETTEEVKLYRLDLGCGDNKCAPDFIGVDIAKTPAVDIVMDLEKYPWKFEDDSVDAINVSHYLEHVTDIIKFMDECYRIMKVGAQMSIVSPYYSSVRATQDPTHKQFISEMTFLYYNKGWRDANKLSHYGIKADFDFSYAYQFHPNWQTRSEEARNFALIHYINVVTDIQVVLTKRPKEYFK